MILICVFSPSLGFAVMRPSIACVFVGVANFLGWSFPYSILYRAGFVARYWLNLILSWNILFCPSMVIENFVGYISLGWHPWSLNVCIMLDHNLLGFIVSSEKQV